jgi:hypothetical protein
MVKQLSFFGLLSIAALLMPTTAAAQVPTRSAPADVRATRFPENPIVVPASSNTLGHNINGPSLIRVPGWVSHPLGKYYLYFAHHGGTFIRLAYSERLHGPWHIYEPGTLELGQASGCYDHVASPDVHVDGVRHEIRMYFHCPAGNTGSVDIQDQKTFVATSSDGLRFNAHAQPLGPAYFRVFQYGSYFYAIVRGGLVLRSAAPDAPFERGPTLIKPDNGRILRHAAVDVQGDVLRIYYSRIGDRPEELLGTTVHLTSDWNQWVAAAPVVILAPERKFEGGDLPLAVSEPNDAPGRVRQLRDPAIYREGAHVFLLYSIAGESGLALAEVVQR